MQSNPQSLQLSQTLEQALSVLLSREHLCSSVYLSKHIKPTLTLPLYIISEERRIAQITNNEQLIIQAIEETSLAKVVNKRDVQLIDYPTIKISSQNPKIFQQIETILEQQQKLYLFSTRLENNYVNLTIYQEDQSFIDFLISSLSEQVQYQKVTLYSDIKNGVDSIKRNKHENWAATNRTMYYSLERPPQIFIRRAVQSEEDEQIEKERPKEKQSKKRRYRQAEVQPTPTIPLFNNQDFPCLI